MASQVALLGAGLTPTAARAAPVEYVKVCTTYGAGYQYTPGTEECADASILGYRLDTEVGQMTNTGGGATVGKGSFTGAPMPDAWGESATPGNNSAFGTNAWAGGDPNSGITMYPPMDPSNPEYDSQDDIYRQVYEHFGGVLPRDEVSVALRPPGDPSDPDYDADYAAAYASASGVFEGNFTNLRRRPGSAFHNLNTTAVGTGAQGGAGGAGQNNATAVGQGAKANALNATALGQGAEANVDGAVALGQGSIATEANTVSVGRAGFERRIVNVAAGALTETSTDVVVGSQLFGATSSMAAALGGGASVNASGVWTGPNFSVQGSNYTNVGAALTALDTQVNTNTDDIADLQTDVATNTSDIAQLQTDVGANTTAIGALQTDLSDLQTDVAVNTSDIADLQTDVAANTTAIGDLQTDVTDLQADVAANTTSIGNLQSNVSGLQTDVGALQTDVADLQTDVGGLQTDVAALETDVAANTTAIGELTTDVTGLQTDVTAQGAAIDGLETTVTAHGTALTSLQSGQTAASGRIDDLEDGIASGTIGLVQQDADDESITVAAASGGATVGFAGTDGDRRLTGVAAGVMGTDVVNVAQLEEAIASVTVASGQVGEAPEGVAGPEAEGEGSYAAGYGAVAEGDDTTAMGTGAQATYEGATAIGAGARATADPTTAVGFFAAATGNNASAFGGLAEASGENSTAIGESSVASATGATALGRGAIASAANSVALGTASVAERGAQANYAALGLSAPQTSVGEVSVGTASGARQITNVAAGSAPNDAVNVSQLAGVRDEAMAYTNLAAAVFSQDLHQVRREAEAGTAAALATAGLVQATEPGKSMLTGGVGVWRGESAIAFGLSHRFEGRWTVKAAGTYATEGGAGMNAAFGFEF